MSDCLLLNANMSPVSLLPLSAISWKKAIQHLVAEEVAVLEWHDHWIVHSANWETKVPSVIMLKEYHNKKAYVRYSKQSVFLRDGYVCQYCGTSVTRSTATLDHVVPTSLGGKSTWENSTTSCGPCNSNKGNNKKIVPKVKPHKATYWELAEKRKAMRFDIKYPEWELYLT